MPTASSSWKKQAPDSLLNPPKGITCPADTLIFLEGHDSLSAGDFCECSVPQGNSYVPF